MAGKAPAIQVEGARELRKALKTMDSRLDDLKDAHTAAAAPVLSEAQHLVPVEDGGLFGSLRTNRRAAGVDILAGSARIPYAGPIHFGWPARNIEPQPFLYDALDARADEVRAAYEAHIDGLVRRFDREAP